MEKVNTREEAASRLRAKEEEINRRIESLQEEVKQTKQEVVDYVKDNPWLGVTAATFAGVLVGLILGKRSDSTKQRGVMDLYAHHVSEMAGNSGVTEEQVRAILREALFESAQQAMYSASNNKSSGWKGKLFGLVKDVAFGYASKSLMNVVEAQLASFSQDSSSEDE